MNLTDRKIFECQLEVDEIITSTFGNQICEYDEEDVYRNEAGEECWDETDLPKNIPLQAFVAALEASVRLHGPYLIGTPTISAGYKLITDWSINYKRYQTDEEVEEEEKARAKRQAAAEKRRDTLARAKAAAELKARTKSKKTKIAVR
jgi:hypothetical protein